MEIKNTRIGDFIQNRREELEMTQPELATQLPIAASTLGQIERGEIATPSIPVLEALADALDVALSTLLDLLTEDAEPLEQVAANMAKIFSGPDDPKLPENVTERPHDERVAFVGAFNSRMEDCMAEGGTEGECEGTAFAVGFASANRVAEAKSTAVKLIKQDKHTITIGGMGVIFDGKDLEGDTFTKETNFSLGLVPEKPVFFDHTLSEVKHQLGSVIKISPRDAGLWIEAQLQRNTEYVEEVLKLIEAGALGWSSGSVGHLVRRDEKSVIKSWPIVEFSVTPTPAEPRTLLGMEIIKNLAAKDSAFEAFLPEVLEGTVDAKEEQTADSEILLEEIITQKENQMSNVTLSQEQLDEMLTKAAQKAADHIMSKPANDVGYATEPESEKVTAKTATGTKRYLQAAKNYISSGSTKDMTLTPDSAGGYLVPDDWNDFVTSIMTQNSVFRRLPGIRMRTRANGRVIHDVSADVVTAADIVGECVAFPDKQPALSEELINTFKYACKTTASHELLQDSMFNISDLLEDRTIKSFWLGENRDFVLGDGSSAPQGVLNGGTQGVLSALPTAITADELIDLMFSLDTPYTEGGESLAWLMNRTTAAYIRKLKDGDDRYLWSTGGGLVDGAQATLLDYPVFIVNTMPSIAAGTKPVVLGNFSAMTLYDVGNVEFLRDPYTQADCGVLFRWWKRVASRVHDSEAIKFLEMAP